MLVTVVLPCRNSSDTIERAVESVLNQSHKAMGLIVVNDGSTDATTSVLEQIATRDHRVEVISMPHAGVANAFNCGLKMAKGKYIARMDADDVMHPSKIAKQVEFLERHPEIGVVSCLVNYGGDRITQEGYARHVDWINSLVTPGEIALNRFIDSPVCNPSVMFRRESAEQYGGALNGDFPEDYEMWLRWMDAGVLFSKVPEVLFTWNDLPTRLTRNDERYSPAAFERAKTKYLVNFIRKNNPVNRPLYICGTGRITRKKSAFLIESGMTVGGYLEIAPEKTGKTYNGIPVIPLDRIPAKTQAYVVSYVSVRGEREKLRALFVAQGRAEGNDFVMAG